MKQRLSKCTGVIYKSGSIFLQDSLRTLYCTLLLPYITYCSKVWGSASKNLLDNIVKAQKKVVRVISKVSKFTSASVLFSNLQIVKFYDLVDVKIAVYVFKARNGMLPSNIQSSFLLSMMHKELFT